MRQQNGERRAGRRADEREDREATSDGKNGYGFHVVGKAVDRHKVVGGEKGRGRDCCGNHAKAPKQRLQDDLEDDRFRKRLENIHLENVQDKFARIASDVEDRFHTKTTNDPVGHELG